jgi:hypothetical protein
MSIKRHPVVATTTTLEPGQRIALSVKERYDPRGPRIYRGLVHGLTRHGFYVVITEKPGYVYILKEGGEVIAYAIFTKNAKATADYALKAERFWDDRDPTKKFYNSRPGWETWTAAVS